MRIMFVGDVCLGEYYPSIGHGPATFAHAGDVFSKVREIFAQADFVVGNLEAPITDLKVHDQAFESAVLRAQPDRAHDLKEAGFRVMQVANNHMVQHSAEGFRETLFRLREAEINAIGLANQEPVSFEVEGIKVCFLAASDVPDNTDKNQSLYQELDSEFITRVKAAVGKYDHVVVMLHWGLEASTKPLPYQKELIDDLHNAGVSAVIGSHPHLFYQIERRQRFVAAPSLGNFLFDLGWDSRLLKSGILDLTFSARDIEVRFWPVILEENGCLPTPSGDYVKVTDVLVPYDLGTSMSLQQIKKLVYFVRNLPRGDTRLKVQFITAKIRSIFATG